MKNITCYLSVYYHISGTIMILIVAILSGWIKISKISKNRIFLEYWNANDNNVNFYDVRIVNFQCLAIFHFKF